jgi:hypothetical protein
VEREEALRIWCVRRNIRKGDPNCRAFQRISHRVKSRENRLEHVRIDEKFGPHCGLKDLRSTLKAEGIEKQSVTAVELFTS